MTPEEPVASPLSDADGVTLASSIVDDSGALNGPATAPIGTHPSPSATQTSYPTSAGQA